MTRTLGTIGLCVVLFSIAVAYADDSADDWNKIHEWIDRMQSGDVGRGPMQFRFMHPGTILPPGANVRPPLPDNMTVIITKEGAKPANVVVRRNGKSWEVTEKELDKLPDNVRKHVELILGNFSEPLPKWIGRKHIHRLLDRPDVPLEFVPDWPHHGRMSDPILKEPAAASSDSFEKRLERRFDEMNRRIEQIHKLLEQMRK